MDKEKIAKIVSQVRAKEKSNLKTNTDTLDINTDKVAKIANVLLDIEKCMRLLED